LEGAASANRRLNVKAEAAWPRPVLSLKKGLPAKGKGAPVKNVKY
jgi:hypothetical protein